MLRGARAYTHIAASADQAFTVETGTAAAFAGTDDDWSPQKPT